MTKKRQRALNKHGIEVSISDKEAREQEKYLDGLPKAEQLQIIAEATGIPVMTLLMEIAKLNGDIMRIDEDGWDGDIPRLL